MPILDCINHFLTLESQVWRHARNWETDGLWGLQYTRVSVCMHRWPSALVVCQEPACTQKWSDIFQSRAPYFKSRWSITSQQRHAYLMTATRRVSGRSDFITECNGVLVFPQSSTQCSLYKLERRLQLGSKEEREVERCHIYTSVTRTTRQNPRSKALVLVQVP